MVLPPENVRWVQAKKVRHVAEGCPCAVVWTHGGGCTGGGAFRPATRRPDWHGLNPVGDITAWVAVRRQARL